MKTENRKPQILVNVDPKSYYAESIRSIRTNLQFSGVNKEVKTILMTSPEPSDGKSFTSANLAVAYAQEGKKVLIIDCDLRRGSQHKIFNVIKDPSKGYSNLILNYEDDMNYHDYLVKTNIKNVTLIPNGGLPPNPIELLSSKKNEKLIKKLKEEFDIIIFDCPPTLGLSDAMIMTKYSDVNIVIVSSKKTKTEDLREVKKSFEKVNSTITGIILNKSTAKKTYYSYRY